MKLFALIYFSVFIISLSACSNYPKDVTRNVKNAGSNRAELERVIHHYKNSSDSMKLASAYFLIGNMENKYSISGSNLNRYYSILYEMDQIKNREDGGIELDKLMKIKYDSVYRNYGPINFDNLDVVYDLNTITSEFLIKNIDLSFEVWNLPWAKHVPFSVFCETILPYRIHNEPLSNWREEFYNKYMKRLDSIENKNDPKNCILKLSADLLARWNHFNDYSSHGFYPDLLMMDSLNGGLCEHRYFLFTGICRSLGLPVAIDYTPQWSTAEDGHSWNVLYDIDTRYRPFNGGEDNIRFYEKNLIPMVDGSFVGTKIYRKHYSVSEISPTINKVLDQLTFDLTGSTDVTSEYDFNKYNCSLEVENNYNGKVAYLSTINRGMSTKIVAATVIENGNANFGEIGIPAFYIPSILDDLGNRKIIHQALLLPVDEKYQGFYNPDLTKKDTIRIWRKYYPSAKYMEFANEMLGGRFQGSNDPEFKEYQDLYIIEEAPLNYIEVVVDTEDAFRFLRYIPAEGNPIHLAEISFYGKDAGGCMTVASGDIIYKIGKTDESPSKLENSFDKNIRTNFNAGSGSWIGLDLGANAKFKVEKIGFLPRNNYNVIEIGNEYELFYLDQNLNWKTLGYKIAEHNYIDFPNVPYSCLLFLKNHTTGKQERNFMYDQKFKIQYWW